MITLVTGYSRSGKTTLPLLFNSIINWNYAVYSKDRALRIREVFPLQISKLAKKDIIYMNKLSFDLLSCENKDKIIDQTNNKTFRSLVDEYVLETRKKDPEYFIRNCFIKNILGSDGMNIMLTDFRFPEDYNYLIGQKKIVNTIRIYREESEPKKLDLYLDHIETDFLLLPLNNHELIFPKVVKKMPQYAKYTKANIVYFYQ